MAKCTVGQEDIHMAIEARLIEKVGKVGGKLHTARSRNDQVATDLRLFTKEAITNTTAGLGKLQRALVELVKSNQDVTGHLVVYFVMLQRDIGRFNDCLKRVDVMPLGSGALAGVAYDVDREFLAKELGFSQISQNSIDAVSDRDFVLDYEIAASICMRQLSGLAEEIDEAYAKLVSDNTARVCGRLFALLTTLKGLPLAYNRDLQEATEGLFYTVDMLVSTLEVLDGKVRNSI